MLSYCRFFVFNNRSKEILYLESKYSISGVSILVDEILLSYSGNRLSSSLMSVPPRYIFEYVRQSQILSIISSLKNLN